jgi:hypothetical protein
MTTTPPPDPWNPSPDPDPGANPAGQQPAGWDPYAQQQPAPPAYPPYPGQQQGYPGQPDYPGGQPGYPGGQPGYPGYPVQSRFDPADPLVSDDFAGWTRRTGAIIKAGWKKLAILQLIILTPLILLSIPFNIGMAFWQRDLAENLTNQAATGTIESPFASVDPAVAVALIVGAVVVGILVSLWFALGTLATVRMVVSIATGTPLTIGGALRSVVGRLPAYIGWAFLAGLISIVALLACILPVFYVAAVFAILTPVIVFERTNVISRCFQLFHADFGSAAARVVTIAAVSIGAGVVVATMSSIGTAAVGGGTLLAPSLDASTASLIASSIISAVFNLASYLFSGVVITPLIVATYADLRARREPFTTSQLITS